MENKNLLGIIPNTFADLLANYVLVKAPVLVKETEDGPKLALRLMCVKEASFMEVVPVDRCGHPETYGGMMVEITHEGISDVCSFFSGYYATKESDYHVFRNKMEGEFVTVLRETEGFVRGKYISITAMEIVKKHISTAQKIIDALHHPIAKVGQCREIVSEYDKLPLKWRNVIDSVTFYK